MTTSRLLRPPPVVGAAGLPVLLPGLLVATIGAIVALTSAAALERGDADRGLPDRAGRLSGRVPYGLGRRLGLSPQLSLLTGTGYAICGASAVTAMREVVDADDDEAAFAIALVTLFGTAAIVVLPVLGGALDLPATAFGQWAGASVHDVGQVVATAATGGPDALAVAVVVKLTRALMLGPLVLAAGLLWRRRTRRASGEDAAASASTDGLRGRPPLLPVFIVGFLAAVALRTLDVIPAPVLDVIRTGEVWVLTAAMVGLGTGVRLARLRRVGVPGAAPGLVAWVVVAAVAYAGVVLVEEAGGSIPTSSGA